MKGHTDTDRVLALSGIYQAARLAHEVARSGACDSAAFSATRDALFLFDAPSTAAVFGGQAGVSFGLRTLLAHLERTAPNQLEVARYVVALMHLGDRLRRNREAMTELHDALAALARRHDLFGLGPSVLNEQLAEIYQTHISPLGPRIMVRGEPLHLRNSDNVARVRCALLGGIRAVVLWRQTGGRKWQLLLRRAAQAEAARALIQRPQPPAG